jgi:hypothetical protein
MFIRYTIMRVPPPPPKKNYVKQYYALSIMEKNNGEQYRKKIKDVQ